MYRYIRQNKKWELKENVKIKENKIEMERPHKKEDKEITLAINVRNLEFSSDIILKQWPNVKKMHTFWEHIEKKFKWKESV